MRSLLSCQGRCIGFDRLLPHRSSSYSTDVHLDGLVNDVFFAWFKYCVPSRPSIVLPLKKICAIPRDRHAALAASSGQICG